MVTLFFLTAIVSIIVYNASGESANTEHCPLWMDFQDGECLCKDFPEFPDTVFCDPTTLMTYVAAGTCMTYDNTSGQISIGDCPYIPAEEQSYDYQFYYRKMSPS